MVHFFTDNFTFRYELIVENVLAVKGSCKMYQRILAKFVATVYNNYT